jgi:hypothetical protein
MDFAVRARNAGANRGPENVLIPRAGLTPPSDDSNALLILLGHNLRQILVRGGLSGVVVNGLFQLGAGIPILLPVMWSLCVVWLLVMGYWIRLGLVGPTAVSFPQVVRRILYRWTIRLLWLVAASLSLKLGLIPIAGVVAAPALQAIFAASVWRYSTWLVHRSAQRPGLQRAEWLFLFLAIAAFGVAALLVSLGIWAVWTLGVALS